VARYESNKLLRNIDKFLEGDGDASLTRPPDVQLPDSLTPPAVGETEGDTYRSLNVAILPQMSLNSNVDQVVGGTRFSFFKKLILRFLRPVAGRQAVFNYHSAMATEMLALKLDEVSEKLNLLTDQYRSSRNKEEREISEAVAEIAALREQLEMNEGSDPEKLQRTSIGWRRVKERIEETIARQDEVRTEVERMLTEWSTRLEDLEERNLQATQYVKDHGRSMWDHIERIETLVESLPVGSKSNEAGEGSLEFTDFARSIDQLSERIINVRREASDNVDSVWKEILTRTKAHDDNVEAIRQIHIQLSVLEAELREVRARLIVTSEQQAMLLDSIQQTPSQQTQSAPKAIPQQAEAPSAISSEQPTASPIEQRQLELAYLRFQRQYRGDEKQLRERQRLYVRVIREHADQERLQSGEFRLLDVACGDGIFVQMLQEEGWEVQGVDINAAMAKFGQDRDLPIIVDDALHYLHDSSQPSAWDVITAFQFVEHLTPAQNARLLRGAVRCLRPGGIIIIETLNPNTIMAHKWFHLDLTHERLIFPQMMELLMETCGLRHVENSGINEVSKFERLHLKGDKEMRENFDRLNGFLYGPQDYYIVGRKLAEGTW
jgi:2-polyprenyl-3-methyl-5-hydroxy-6-metoxy-1,4-benzoquinol methylase